HGVLEGDAIRLGLGGGNGEGFGSVPRSGGLPGRGNRLGLLPGDLPGLLPPEFTAERARDVDLAAAAFPLLGAFLELARAGLLGVPSLAFLAVPAVQVEGHVEAHSTTALPAIAR